MNRPPPPAGPPRGPPGPPKSRPPPPSHKFGSGSGSTGKSSNNPSAAAQQPPLVPPPPPIAHEYFSESQLPSCKSSYCTPVEERTIRRRTCRFLEEACRVLKLPRVAMSTSMVLLHRFYAVHSFEHHDRFEVAVGCILLAAKTEESPKKLISVLQECYRLKNQSKRAAAAAAAAKKSGSGSSGSGAGASLNLASVSEDGKTRTDKRGYLDLKCETFIKLKERILLLERVILHTIGFELSIDHPYKFLVEQIKKMVPSRQVEYIASSSGSNGTSAPTLSMAEQTKMTNELVQNAMNFANDSMHTSLCLQYDPEVVAQTCVYMSGQYCKMRPTEGRRWLDVLDECINMGDLASTAIQIMELIADKKGIDKKTFIPIHADIERMKKLMGVRTGTSTGAGGHTSRSGDRPRPPPGSSEQREAKRPRM